MDSYMSTSSTIDWLLLRVEYLKIGPIVLVTDE
jgi:hypothetical protein